MQTFNEKSNVDYEYKNAPVPGGGFVTGFCFHPNKKDILYARTDIGGVYRYNFEKKSWKSLVDHVTVLEKWETYPLSIALDPVHPEWLYVVAGDWEKNYLCRSKDYGEHFEYFPIPAGVHGNAPGRGTGERLIVDPSNPSIIYFGSQTNGLLISEDYGESWSELQVKPDGGNPELDIAFVWIDPRTKGRDRCKTIVVSTSGKENSPGNNIRASSIYISIDAGKTFTPMPNQPQIIDYGNFPGFVGQRATQAGDYLFITMAATELSWQGWRGYGCDMGGNQKGCILRYELTKEGDIIDVQYVTPDLSYMGGGSGNISDICGFGGISSVADNQNIIICSSQNSSKGDTVLYSNNYGKDWFSILYDLEIGKMEFDEVPYMKPEYNGNANIIHWLSDIKIDPFNSNRAVFNTGTGVFMTENLQAANDGDIVVWRPSCRGIEETVHLNVYSPPSGDVKLIDIIGDLGGFTFTDLDSPCENSFADEDGNRYITCLNADYPDNRPRFVAVTARGNWKGKTTGGLIWSQDQCKTWTRLPDPLGISKRIDKLINEIRKPNTNSGWTAISSDGKTLVWSVGEGNRLPIEAVVYTNDLGKTWHKAQVFDLNGNIVNGASKTLKVLSDREDEEVFYGFGDDSHMYISTDSAKTFDEINVAREFPRLELGGIDGLMPAEIRAESGKTGVVWISTGEGGLWKLEYNKNRKEARFKKVSKDGDMVFRQGMGKAAGGSKFKTLYINGVISGEYGFYRSFDEGISWQGINNKNQMYGDIRSIVGDPREFGRFYIGTGSRGVLVGQEKE